MSILFNKILVKPLDLIEHVCYIFGVNKILVILSLINKNLVSQFSTAGTSKIAHSSFGQAFDSLPSLKNQEIDGTQKQRGMGGGRASQTKVDKSYAFPTA